MDTRIEAIIASPCVLAVLILVLGSFIGFQPKLNPYEQEVLGFVPEDLTLPERRGMYQAESIRSPIEIRSLTERAERATAEGAFQGNRVTMVIVGDLHKLAMIDGQLVREGDAVGSLVVQQIESRRVLVKGSQLDSGGKPYEQMQWLYLEDKQ